MILKKIKIKNFRSYEDQEIIFPKGSTLLSGDIGCGKTSVLLAIEFALFGLQPSQKATALMKNDKEDSKIILECSIEGKEIIIERTLKKSKKSITQDYVSITVDNEKFEESIGEIKARILTLLNYPQEFSKKTNLLYKFTVYTPQEEMKQIILESGDTRLNTLRHVFGIDKYKRIEENASIITAKLREKIKINEIITATIEAEKGVLQQKEKNSAFLQEKNLQVAHEHQLKENEKNEKEIEVEEIRKRIEEKKILETEKAKTEILMLEKERQLRTVIESTKNLGEEIRESNQISFNEEEYESCNQRIQFQKGKESEFQREYIEIVSKINAEQSREKEAHTLKNKIAILDNCPTCLQKVEQEYKNNIINNSDRELANSSTIIAMLLQEKKQLMLKIEDAKKITVEFETKKSAMQLLKMKKETIKEKEKRLADLEKEKTTLQQDSAFLKKHAEGLEKSIREFDKFQLIFMELEKELKKIKDEERAAVIKKAEINKELQYLNEDITERKKIIEKKEEIKKEANRLKELEYWISEKFIDVILFAEKQVMITLKDEFSKLFSKWFSILVSESLSAHINEDFAPIIEQQDYEIEYDALSGGERTAIALAYRLALNQVINDIVSNIKTANLVILDEPTDGFSHQQLNKMRDVLDELNMQQLIIVSHEPQIESFVDNIIKIKKENGISVIEALHTH
ncbi:MAG: AAA family ATPase [Nanoarchaeota archaeon]